MQTSFCTPSYPLDSVRVSDYLKGALPPHDSSYKTLRRGRVQLQLLDSQFDPAHDACVVAIGAFDGMHRGHHALIEHAQARARELACACVALTFEPDPARVLLPEQPIPELLSCDERLVQLRATGLAAVGTLNFTPELAATPYEDFIHTILPEAFCVRSIVVGSDFRLGAQGAGDVAALQSCASELGINVEGIALESFEGSPVTATRIRKLIAQGQMHDAAQLLGRLHAVHGIVVHGRGAGTSFGFPTANVALDAYTCAPLSGVFAGCAVLGDKAWPAAINAGTPPSFDAPHSTRLLEANLLGFSGNLYDQELSLVFFTKLRDSVVFHSQEKLTQTVLSNIEWVSHNIGSAMVEVKL